MSAAIRNAPATMPLLRWEDLPGPRPWPVVGNAVQIERDRMHQQLESWAARYGRPFKFRIASRRFLVITDPDAIAKVLRDRPDGFKRPSRVERISREFGFLGLFSANGETWKRQRPMVLGSFDPTHIKAFFPTLAGVTQRLAGRWTRAAQAGAAIDLQADLMRYTVDVTAALAFGEDINTLESDEDVIQVHLNHVLPALVRRSLAPFDTWKYFPTRADRELQQHLDAIQVAVQSFIARTRRKLAEQPGLREKPVNLIQAMIATRDREGGGLTDEDVSGNVLTMLLAGEDTTANTLAWLVWLLHRHPDARQRAAAEARTVLAGAVCPTAPEQLSRLDWIDACANEAMRLKPVAPLIFNEALRTTLVEAVQVERGDIVVCLMRAGSLQENNFAQARAFRPERWLAGEGAAAHSLASAKRVVMPFGAGPRMCPGRYLALAEIKMAAAMLLANFELASVATPGAPEPREEIALTMYPVGLQMHLSLPAAASM